MMVKVKSLKAKSKKSNSSYKLVSKKKSKKSKQSKQSKQSKMNKKTSKSVKSKKRYTGRRKYFKTVLKGGDPCEYVKVEGVKLPQLDIPDQLAKLNNDCNSVTTPTGSPAVQHPNIGN
jgi:hypothetical protein